MLLHLSTPSTRLTHRTIQPRTMRRTRISHLHNTTLINTSHSKHTTRSLNHNHTIRIRTITRNNRRTHIAKRINRSPRLSLQMINHSRSVAILNSRNTTSTAPNLNTSQSILRIQIQQKRPPNHHSDLIRTNISPPHIQISRHQRLLNMNTSRLHRQTMLRRRPKRLILITRFLRHLLINQQLSNQNLRTALRTSLLRRSLHRLL